MGLDENGMEKYIDQTRPRHCASIYQKSLKDYQKVKIRRPPWTGVDKCLKFPILMLYNMKLTQFAVEGLFQSSIS